MTTSHYHKFVFVYALWLDAWHRTRLYRHPQQAVTGSRRHI